MTIGEDCKYNVGSVDTLLKCGVHLTETSYICARIFKRIEAHRALLLF
jgi:hypothetical protein